MASVIHPEKKGASRIRDKRSQKESWTVLADDEKNNNPGKKRERATTSKNTTSNIGLWNHKSASLQTNYCNSRRETNT